MKNHEMSFVDLDLGTFHIVGDLFAGCVPNFCWIPAIIAAVGDTYGHAFCLWST